MLVEADEENLASHRCTVEKRSILIGFSSNFGYSLLLHQNLTGGRSFLKVNCSVNSETVSVNVSKSVL